ncbi:MAG: hypothetical protein WC308_04545, partial [archaeon]
TRLGINCGNASTWGRLVELNLNETGQGEYLQIINEAEPKNSTNKFTSIYFSGCAFFNSCNGEVLPIGQILRFATLFESAIGVFTIAIFIGGLINLTERKKRKRIINKK